MQSKKVIRYYSDCGRGFWKKQQAISHDENCKCWKNPKYESCLSCVNKCIRTDSNGMEDEPQFFQTWKYNACEYSEKGIPVHKYFDYIRMYCINYKNKLTK